MQSKLEGIIKGKGSTGSLRTIVVFEDVSMVERSMCQQVSNLGIEAGVCTRDVVPSCA